MSNQAVTDLLELTSEHIMYWEGTPMARVLEADLEREDFETLQEHLKESARLMYESDLAHAEMDEPMTDERAEAMIGDNDVF